MLTMSDLTPETFETLPLLRRGESKEIRALGTDEHGVELCAIRFLPTIYSFTANRTGVVPGSDNVRLRCSRVLVQVLKDAGIRHAYREVGEHFVIAEWIDPDPNVEVIVKAYHAGTSKHRYYGMAGRKVRSGTPFVGVSFPDMGAYPHEIVRFDWRNPFQHPETGAKLADEVMPEDIADWWIDTKVARQTALQTFMVLGEFLEARDVVIYDLCLFISQDGRTVFGEISPDCGRFRHYDLGELDKDVWRAGGSADDVLAKWELLCSLIGA